MVEFALRSTLKRGPALEVMGSAYLPVDTYTLRLDAGIQPSGSTFTVTFRLQARNSGVDTITVGPISTDLGLNSSAAFVIAAAGLYDIFAEIGGDAEGNDADAWLFAASAQGTAGGGGGSVGIVPPVGDIGGTILVPTVIDLTLTGEAVGDVPYFNGTNWVPRSAAEVFAAAGGVGAGTAVGAASVFTISPNVGDIGDTVPLIVEAGGAAMNIAAATSRTFRFQPPGARAYFDRTPSFVTDGSDGALVYTTILNDITVAGRWMVWAIVVGPWGTRYSDSRIFYVEP